ncbi:hypothetical protein DFH06DRAFT_191956 [Mycena polygramma]|nr:hypothetical protein DFH06DRAFT_191956 [Mycena polygramma]
MARRADGAVVCTSIWVLDAHVLQLLPNGPALRTTTVRRGACRQREGDARRGRRRRRCVVDAPSLFTLATPPRSGYVS